MNTLTLNDFVNLLTDYSQEDVEMIVKAYYYAYRLHQGQKRQSGEDYIIHPLNVAYILASIHADRDTICAGFLHDTLEDTNVTKEDIAHDFNKDVANLVDGVTKISKMNFNSKIEQNNANQRKIITSIVNDVRIIIVKLADRLHNMRTIEFKTHDKQVENAEETLELFVPLAYYLGCYRIKSELEDISFKVLNPNEYEELLDKKNKIEERYSDILEEMKYKISYLLNEKNIPNEIKIRTKNIYGIYKKILDGYKISNIHDLLALKVMVNEVDECYIALGCVHSIYNPFNSRFKDYIHNPKTNGYQSLHTTLFAPGDRLVQTQIRTFDMDKIASFGLPAYWELIKDNSKEIMQDDLKNKFQFYRLLNEINNSYDNDQEFIDKIKEELFVKQIYVYSNDGTKIQLPTDSTLIDYAYRLDKKVGDTLVYGIVNDAYVSPNHLLKNNDRVVLITNSLDYGYKSELENTAKTTYARKMIRQYKND